MERLPYHREGEAFTQSAKGEPVTSTELDELLPDKWLASHPIANGKSTRSDARNDAAKRSFGTENESSRRPKSKMCFAERSHSSRIRLRVQCLCFASPPTNSPHKRKVLPGLSWVTGEDPLPRTSPTKAGKPKILTLSTTKPFAGSLPECADTSQQARSASCHLPTI